MHAVNLTELTTELLVAARGSGSGRAARTVHGGRDAAMRQTVMAIVAGHGLGEHDSPAEATLQVLSGSVTLAVPEGERWHGQAGDLVVIPDARHTLDAVDDSVVLLTAVPREVVAG